MTRSFKDKNIESSRFNERAKMLLAKDMINFEISEALFFPLIYRKPYIEYEQCHRKYINEKSNVLEIGAGTGILTYSILKTGACVTATDISPNSVKVIKQRYGNKISTKVADMENLPFDNELFDVVCSAGSLSYGNNEIVMSEIYRVLKPSGMFICVDSLHENPIYIVNRWLGYVVGKRTLSTITRMPTLKLIEQYQNHFDIMRIKFFGSLTWIAPLLKYIIGPSNTAIFLDKFDNVIHVRRSAFKFVMALRKKQNEEHTFF